MKIVFMGTPDFAVSSLEALLLSHEVVAVVTQPDKPKGRGKKMMCSPVKEFAIEKNIPVLQPIKIRKDEEFFTILKSYSPDLIVVVAFGQILPVSILELPKFGCICVHGSLLPKYRGAAPIQWSVIDGEDVTGVTIIYMDKGIDTGDMILKSEFKIESSDTFGTVHDKMAPVGADALIEAIKQIENGTAKREKQKDELSSYASMITKETSKIDWNNKSSQIINLIRGLNPVPVAYTYYNNELIKIWAAEIFDCSTPATCGEVIDVIKNKGIVVKTSDSAVLITEIQGQNGKRMSTSDYLRGHTILCGEFFK